MYNVSGLVPSAISDTASAHLKLMVFLPCPGVSDGTGGTAQPSPLMDAPSRSVDTAFDSDRSTLSRVMCVSLLHFSDTVH